MCIRDRHTIDSSSIESLGELAGKYTRFVFDDLIDKPELRSRERKMLSNTIRRIPRTLCQRFLDYHIWKGMIFVYIYRMFQIITPHRTRNCTYVLRCTSHVSRVLWIRNIQYVYNIHYTIFSMAESEKHAYRSNTR